MAVINDGFSTTIAIGSGVAGVTFFEKKVTPPGYDGGGENDTTTMRNTAWRTRQPKALKTLTNSKTTVAYDPALYTSILALINVNGLVVITFSDAHTLTFWGWLDKFTPGECAEGEQPTAEIEIIASNQNDSGVETAPSYA